MKQKSLPFVVATVWMMLTGLLYADTLVSDNFDSLINGNGARAASGKYSTGATASTWWLINPQGATPSAINTYTGSAPTGNFSGNWLQVNFNNDGSGGTSGLYNWAVSPFTSTTLSHVGDTLTVQFDFRYLSGTLGGNDRSPQFGFLKSASGSLTSDVANTASTPITGGYGANMTYISPTSSAAVLEMSNWFATGEANLASNAAIAGSPLAPPYTENYKFVLTSVATGIKMDLYLNDTLIVTGTDTTSPYYTFDEFAIRARGTAQIDNFSIFSSVPEPGSASLLVLSVAVLLFTMRQRRAAAV